jgi:hypothetical protein
MSSYRRSFARTGDPNGPGPERVQIDFGPEGGREVSIMGPYDSFIGRMHLLA